jgi:hypothetical protein
MRRKTHSILISKRRKQRKGNAAIETVVLIVFFFIIAIGIPVVKHVLNGVTTDINSDPEFDPQYTAYLNQQNNNFSNLWDGLFAFAFISLMIVMVIAAYFVQSHPVFIIVVFFLILPVTFIGIILSNAHEEMISGDFSTEYSTFPLTNYLMGHLPQLAVIMILMIALAMYAKGRFG